MIGDLMKSTLATQHKAATISLTFGTAGIQNDLLAPSQWKDLLDLGCV